MPTEVAAIVTGVVVVFAVFMAALAWVDVTTNRVPR